jgi:hypothetical protein
VPRPRRMGRPLATRKHARPGMADLQRAAEILLTESLRQK